MNLSFSRDGSLGPVALMLLRAVNGNQPALSPRDPQLITGGQIGRRFIECASPDFHFIRAIYDPENRRSTRWTIVTIVG
jgi:hypothetical protein